MGAKVPTEEFKQHECAGKHELGKTSWSWKIKSI